MLAKCAQCPLGPLQQVKQLCSFSTVINRDDLSAFERCRRAVDEGFGLQIDLEDLSFTQIQIDTVAVCGNRFLQFPLPPNELGTIEADKKLPQATLPHHDAIYRKRIDQLVREDDASDRISFVITRKTKNTT